jgi:hypothetical protein
MNSSTLFIDAGFFLGMHDGDDDRRMKSLAYFVGQLSSKPRMNYEQIGICDAVIWKLDRRTQDLYDPFMDRLHSDMAIERSGYCRDEIEMALSRDELKHLSTEQAMLVAQVLHNDGHIATHDETLINLPCLRGKLWDAGETSDAAPFPEELQALYEVSRAFVYTREHELA